MVKPVPVDDEGDRASRAPFVREARIIATILAIFVGIMWLEEIVDQLLFDGSLDHYGIEPRSIVGLRGILFSPFLHGNFNHLMGNTLPLVVLGFVVMIRRKRHLLWVTLCSQLIGGLGVWLIGGSNSRHFGASILVFGYLGYLGSRGVFERRLWPILGSLAVLFLYGSMLWGMFPGDPSISWEGHLFGFIGGMFAARTLRHAPARAEGTAVTAPTAGAPPSPPGGKPSPPGKADARPQARAAST